jgi:penicillin-binding protein 1B
LLCIVWVGYDDYSDLKMSGSSTAAPIWTEFMKKATSHPQYSEVRRFSAPAGVTGVTLDKITNLRATARCPETYSAVFLSGTEPLQTCEEGKPISPVLVSNDSQDQGAVRPAGALSTEDKEKKKKKRGFFGRIFGRDDDAEEEKPEQPPPPSPPAKSGPQAGKDPVPR